MCVFQLLHCRMSAPFKNSLLFSSTGKRGQLWRREGSPWDTTVMWDWVLKRPERYSRRRKLVFWAWCVNVELPTFIFTDRKGKGFSKATHRKLQQEGRDPEEEVYEISPWCGSRIQNPTWGIIKSISKYLQGLSMLGSYNFGGGLTGY